jgi:hypothetical protein
MSSDSDKNNSESDNDLLNEEADDCVSHNEYLSIYTGQAVSKIVTETDLLKYLQDRFRLAEKKELPWPPIMLLVFNKNQHENMSEYLLGTIELILEGPIQLNLVFSDDPANSDHSVKIDLNDEDVVIPFAGRMFVPAKEVIRDMLDKVREPHLTIDDIRPRARFLFKSVFD